MMMDNTLLIQVTNQKAIKLLHDLEELDLIKVPKGDLDPAKTKLSDKYKNVFTEEDAKSFNEHTYKMRNEWEKHKAHNELTVEMKAMLDERLQEDEDTYLTAEESINQLLSIRHKK